MSEQILGYFVIFLFFSGMLGPHIFSHYYSKRVVKDMMRDIKRASRQHKAGG